MYNFENYLSDKKELLLKLDFVSKKIIELEAIGIDCSESLQKIENAKNIVKSDKISVVLVGAFSDGKTSVAAGWINEKLENMKIDTDESSDQILCYTPSSIPDGCQIIDTPGLFGDKKGNDENGHVVKLSDMTKKFISEANLILYVVEAKNPIKDSHKPCINWILKDLNKLSSTIFVINKMDSIADLTDEDDFNVQSKIKTDNLKAKLHECGMSKKEIDNVKVACISSAPDGKDIEVWNNHRDEYLKRSHLPILENMTNSILRDNKRALITKTGCDILNDELTKTINFITEQENEISNIFMPEMKESLKRNKRDLEDLKKRLVRNRSEIKDELRVLEKRKVNVIRSSSIESFRAVMDDEIGTIEGKEGYRIEDEINDIFQKYATLADSQTTTLCEKFQAEYDKRNEAVESLLKKGAGAAINGLKGAGNLGVNTLKGGIFLGRDLLGKIGFVIKFKPWQVTKLATFATKALPAIGAGLDIVMNIVENLTEQARNKKFEEQKDKIIDGLHKTFHEISENLNNDKNYFKEFAPKLEELERQILLDEKDYTDQENLLINFKNWKKNAIDADFIIS